MFQKRIKNQTRLKLLGLVILFQEVAYDSTEPLRTIGTFQDELSAQAEVVFLR